MILKVPVKEELLCNIITLDFELTTSTQENATEFAK